MTNAIPTYDSAESLRKGQRFSEAAEQFAQLWLEKQVPSIGWRYAICLRKLGKLDEAGQVIQDALSKFPDDKMTKSEFGWFLYEKELKPAKEESDLGRAIHFANEILILNSDALAVKVVSLAVMKVAKGKKKWDVVLEWANKLKPEELDNVPKTFDGKRGMSDRETWYVNKAKALLETGNFEESRAFAQNGSQEFPNELFLARTAALALSRMGDIDGAANELYALLSHPRADWYVKSDLAELEFARGDSAEAYRLMCDAASNSNDDEYKLKIFVTLGQIALSLGRNDVAAEHVELAKAVRNKNNWSIPAELLQLEKVTKELLAESGQTWPDLPDDANALSKICHQRWREGKLEGQEFIKGTLGPIRPDKPFSFIRRDDGGENVFVIIRDIPRRCAQEGARLEFTLKKSFDKKKNRESVQAANVQCIKD